MTASARSMLLNLPDVFTLTELGMHLKARGAPEGSAQASQYAWRWKSSNLVLPFGGNSGVYINLVTNPRGGEDGALWERALLKAMPSAIIGGHEVLADSGVTTQVTHQRYVLISNTDSMFEVPGAEVHRRPVPWLNRLVREGAVLNDEPGVLAPRLRPGAALADLALYAARKPDPDDIDMDEIGPDDVALFKRLSKAESIEEVAPKRRAKLR